MRTALKYAGRIITGYVCTVVSLTVWAWEDRRNHDITPAYEDERR